MEYQQALNNVAFYISQNAYSHGSNPVDVISSLCFMFNKTTEEVTNDLNELIKNSGNIQ